MNNPTPAASAYAAHSLQRKRITSVTLVVLCQVFHMLTFSGIALLLPLIRADLEISFSQAGMLSAAVTLTYGFAARSSLSA